MVLGREKKRAEKMRFFDPLRPAAVAEGLAPPARLISQGVGNIRATSGKPQGSFYFSCSDVIFDLHSWFHGISSSNTEP